MEELGFKRKDKFGKETWRNDFNDRIIFDEELKSVYFKDEVGKSFPVDKKTLLATLKIMEEKKY